jgi:hypothetical protein
MLALGSAQGAMSALVVYLYNKMGHESRKDIVLKRARALLKNPAVLKKYKIVLEKLLNSNSVLYNKHMPGFDKEIGDMGFGYGY